MSNFFLPLFEENRDQLPDEGSSADKLISEAAYFALLFALTVASSRFEFTGLSPVHIVITAAILYTVRKRGAARGIAVGALCGAVAGLDYAVLYAVGAAGAALFIELSILAAGAAIPVCGALRSLLFSDAEGFILLFPSQIAGLAIFCLISLFGERLEFSAETAAEAESAPQKPLSGRERMRELSDAFAGLADSFSELAKTRRRPTEGELRTACDSVCDRVCLKCPNRNLCWNLEYASTLDIISKMCSAV